MRTIAEVLFKIEKLQMFFETTILYIDFYFKMVFMKLLIYFLNIIFENRKIQIYTQKNHIKPFHSYNTLRKN